MGKAESGQEPRELPVRRKGKQEAAKETERPQGEAAGKQGEGAL